MKSSITLNFFYAGFGLGVKKKKKKKSEKTTSIVFFKSSDLISFFLMGNLELNLE
jgi:hypothetical protein